MDEKTQAFYDRLKGQLREDTDWPTTYLYKFIVPASEDKVKEIESVFQDTDARIETRDSSKGTYTSVSVKVTMESPEQVVEKYLEVSRVEGVISL
jgi:putative lipoic acid-binding regulatory protein